MDYELISARLKALGHPTRIRILLALQDAGCCVSDLQKRLRLKQSNISQHLRILRDSGFVAAVRHGNSTCYSLEPEHTASVLETLSDLDQ